MNKVLISKITRFSVLTPMAGLRLNLSWIIVYLKSYGSPPVPRRVNILSWVMIFGSLNSADILQKKAPTSAFLPQFAPSV